MEGASGLSPYNVRNLIFADDENSFGNDPSAGSPTETLLRLLRPLDGQVCASFRHTTVRSLPTVPGPIRGAH